MVSESRNRTPILDHGYIELIESWGSDERIVEAARMSTDKGFQGWGPVHHYGEVAVHDMRDWNCECKPSPGDEKLFAYLYSHKHMTPFEMAGMTIEVQAPIFVFREWHRHRTQSYNELSARYTPLPDVNYVPTVERLLMTSDKNKQAQGTGEIMTAEKAENFRRIVANYYRTLQVEYKAFLDCGVPKELARIIIPVGRYSRMRASANLRNWLQFLTLRMDVAAQWEIRQYANAVGDLIAAQFPRTWSLFNVTGPVIK